MRPLTFEEREDLVRRARNMDVLDFVARLKRPHRAHLAKLLRQPRPTDVPLSKVLKVRRRLAESGMEATPAEVTETVQSMFCKLRNNLREQGVEEHLIPESDEEFLAVLSKNISL